MRTSCAHIVTSRRADWPATFEHGAFRNRESRVISTRFPSRSSFPSRSRETYRWKIHRSILFMRFYLYDFIYRAIAFLQRIIKRFSRIISNLARPRQSTSSAFLAVVLPDVSLAPCPPPEIIFPERSYFQPSLVISRDESRSLKLIRYD